MGYTNKFIKTLNNVHESVPASEYKICMNENYIY